MALVKCPECMNMVSTHATVCPNCGFPMNLADSYNYYLGFFDSMAADVAFYVVIKRDPSINSIQKRFDIGFNKAQQCFEELEKLKIVTAGRVVRHLERYYLVKKNFTIPFLNI